MSCTTINPTTWTRRHIFLCMQRYLRAAVAFPQKKFLWAKQRHALCTRRPLHLCFYFSFMTAKMTAMMTAIPDLRCLRISWSALSFLGGMVKPYFRHPVQPVLARTIGPPPQRVISSSLAHSDLRPVSKSGSKLELDIPAVRRHWWKWVGIWVP